MSDLTRRLWIAARESSIPHFAELFGEAAKALDESSKVAEELADRLHHATRPVTEREPPHCPTCGCGTSVGLSDTLEGIAQRNTSLTEQERGHLMDAAWALRAQRSGSQTGEKHGS